jgi:serine phosphatase RsbU (regulator of sigma subunit)
MHIAATFLILISSSGSHLPPPNIDVHPIAQTVERFERHDILAVSTGPGETLAAGAERVPGRTLPAGGPESARSPDEEAQSQRFATAATATDLIHIGAALAFALLHLLLFAFFRREQGNLYFALFALAFAGMTWGAYRLDHPDAGATNSQLVGTLRLTFTCGILQAFALLRFAHEVFLRRAPLAFYLLLAWGAGVVAWIWAVPATSIRIQPVMYLALATTVEMLRTVVLAARRPQRAGIWLIYLGLAALATAGALQSLLALGFLGAYNRPVYSYGVLLFLLAVSIYLSRRFATTALELERQLEEVQKLSERALDQERRARQLEVERRLLEAENERRAKELEEARRLQLSMVPREPPQIPGLDIAFRMLTATEVGGDYYDFRVGDDGALTLAVGDATGHGLNAGLVVASTKSLFQGLEDGLTLSESLQRIDRGLRGMNLRRMGMSLSLARYERGELQVAAAGMPPVLILRRSDAQVEECIFSAPPLGTLKERTFAERSIRLAKGDVALFATDGLVELLDPDDEALGYPAVAEAFREAAGAGAKQAVEGLLAGAREWARGRPLADDLSLVVLRVE